MSALDNLVNFLTGKSQSKDAPEGYCPNCWGRQEYGGKFMEAIKKQSWDISKMDDHRGWIQDYADKNLADISLVHKEGYMECNRCNVKYKEA